MLQFQAPLSVLRLLLLPPPLRTCHSRRCQVSRDRWATSSSLLPLHRHPSHCSTALAGWLLSSSFSPSPSHLAPDHAVAAALLERLRLVDVGDALAQVELRLGRAAGIKEFGEIFFNMSSCSQRLSCRSTPKQCVGALGAAPRKRPCSAAPVNARDLNKRGVRVLVGLAPAVAQELARHVEPKREGEQRGSVMRKGRPRQVQRPVAGGRWPPQHCCTPRRPALCKYCLRLNPNGTSKRAGAAPQCSISQGCESRRRFPTTRAPWPLDADKVCGWAGGPSTAPNGDRP